MEETITDHHGVLLSARRISDILPAFPEHLMQDPEGFMPRKYVSNCVNLFQQGKVVLRITHGNFILHCSCASASINILLFFSSLSHTFEIYRFQ